MKFVPAEAGNNYQNIFSVTVFVKPGIGPLVALVEVELAYAADSAVPCEIRYIDNILF